jgi:hypothetical protein
MILCTVACLAAQTYYGNQFLITSNASIGYMDALNKTSSIRFTAQASKTIVTCWVYIHANTSGSKVHRYGIKEDSGGVPGGAWLGYEDFSVLGSNGWIYIDLNPTVDVTSGEVYHIVVEPVDNPSKALTLRATSPLNQMIVYDQTSDPNSNTLFNDGTSWTVQNYQPVYFLDYSDNTHEGNPCSVPSYASIYSTLCESERFTVSGGDRTIASVGAYLRGLGSPPNDCDFVLYNITDGVEVASGVIATASEITTSDVWYTYDLATSTTLVNGKQYRFHLETTGGNSSNRYLWRTTYNVDGTDFNSRNYDGLNSINQTSYDAGSTWTDDWPEYDTVFRFAEASLSITVDPNAVDLGTVLPGTVNTISQTARPSGEVLVTNSGGVSVRYELRIANPAGWTDVSDPPDAEDEYRLSGLFHPDQAVAPDFDEASPSYVDVIDTTGKTCDGTYFATSGAQDGYDVAPGGTQSLYFDFDAPPSTGVTSQQTITVTITAKPM